MVQCGTDTDKRLESLGATEDMEKGALRFPGLVMQQAGEEGGRGWMNQVVSRRKRENFQSVLKVRRGSEARPGWSQPQIHLLLPRPWDSHASLLFCFDYQMEETEEVEGQGSLHTPPTGGSRNNENEPNNV